MDTGDDLNTHQLLWLCSDCRHERRCRVFFHVTCEISGFIEASNDGAVWCREMTNSAQFGGAVGLTEGSRFYKTAVFLWFRHGKSAINLPFGPILSALKLFDFVCMFSYSN